MTSSQIAHAGNRIGNGGDVGEPLRPEAAQFDKVLVDARTRLYSFFLTNGLWEKSGYFSFLPRPEYQALVNARPSILEVIASVEIHVNRDTPCVDESGKPSDASSVAPDFPRDAICLSRSRLLPKLTADDYSYQTLALLAHEYTHRLGYNEAQAEALQELLRRDLRLVEKFLPEFFPEAMSYGVMALQQEEILAYLYRVIRRFDRLSDREIAYTIYNAVSWDKGFAHSSIRNKFFSREEIPLQVTPRLRLLGIHAALCRILPADAIDDRQSKCENGSPFSDFVAAYPTVWDAGGTLPIERFSDSLEGYDPLMYKHMNQRIDSYRSLPFPPGQTEVVHRVVDRVSLKAELIRVIEGYEFLLDRVVMLSSFGEI